MTIYFTSDTHWFHHNSIKYCNRPYSSVEEMNERMIQNWNSRVHTTDTVYHNGDFSFGNEENTLRLTKRLNGKIHLCLGNHDKLIKKSKLLQECFQTIFVYNEVSINGQFIVLCHYPMLTWNKSHHGSWMLHGHCHGEVIHPWNGKIQDVGVDPMNYSPVSFEELYEILKNKEFVKHHKE